MLYVAWFNLLTWYYLSIDGRFPTHERVFTFVNNYTPLTYCLVYKS